ncbi:MAG: hypothetical protein IPK26_23300 [Planctomycetes bacterium]|nr:hypothetical protein [Planctomycetota bacterium]
MLTPDQNRRLRHLFSTATELPPAGRLAFCARECRGEPELLEELVSLLAVFEREEEGTSE